MSKKTQGNTYRHTVTSLCLCAGVGLGLGFSTIATAGGSADFTMNGTQITASSIAINASETKSLKYTGGSTSCTDVEWFVRLDGENQWDNFDHNNSATLAEIHRSGSHELKLTANGYDGRFFFNLFGCNHSGQYDERVVNLDIATPGYTQTENPVMLVPGVMAWDSILGIEYFYGIADMIRDESDQSVTDVSLQAWQNTEDRGAYLADQIIERLIIEDENFFDANTSMKMNLIAHSHGATTSRMAINILSNEFGDNAKVSSLTTVAGPHFGTPTADGALWAVENWGLVGDFLGEVVIKSLIGDFAGAAVAWASGHSDDYGQQEIMQVLEGFTQKGMARFNTCYPSVGVPSNDRYFIEDPLAGNEPQIEFPEIIDGQITFDDCQSRDTVFSKTGPISIVSTPNEAYGADTGNGGTYGDGLGNVANASDLDAVRYFSFTGIGEWNTSSSIFEISDPALLVINSLFRLPGERSEWTYFDNWVIDTGSKLFSGNPIARDQGYTKDSDSFIPVDSTKFGQYVGTFGPWNHVDETNGIAGMRDPSSVDPIEVYRGHLNRLQLSGL